MVDRWVTVATFWSVPEALIARNAVDAAGLRTNLTNLETVAMDWGLTNAIGGIRLQVLEDDAEMATAILTAPAQASGESTTDHEPADDEFGEAGEWANEMDPVRPVVAESGPPISGRRDQLAGRAYQSAILGLAFFPLQFYAFYLLLSVFYSDEPMTDGPRRKAIIAAAVNLPIMFMVFFGCVTIIR